MSDRFHINSKGNAGPCGATLGKCPFGGESDHYESADEARAVYEAAQSENTFTTTNVRSGEHYSIRVQSDDSPVRATYGSYKTPREAFEALETLSPDQAEHAKVIHVRNVVKTVTHLDEEEVTPDQTSTWSPELQSAVAALEAEYQALEDKRGWVETKGSEAFQTAKVLSSASLYQEPEGYQAAIEARDAARLNLLAADVVHARNANYVHAPDLIRRMVKVELERTRAERQLRTTVARNRSSSLARTLRIQPEDVDEVYERAINKFSAPREFVRGGVSALAENKSWTSEMARKFNCQPEAISYILNIAILE